MPEGEELLVVAMNLTTFTAEEDPLMLSVVFWNIAAVVIG